jgi:hypothetical protein
MFSSGTDFLEGVRTPANYIYFDLIVSYLIILTTKFVKLPILWSQISPCRPRKQVFPWPFRALPPGPGQSKQQHPPPQIFIHPPHPRMKIWKCVSGSVSKDVAWYCVNLPPRKESVSLWNKSAINKNRLIIQVVQLST